MGRGLDGYFNYLTLKALCSFQAPPGRSRKIPVAHSEWETPLPIPNRAVKPLCADGTWGATPWESRSPPVLRRTLRAAQQGRPFVVQGLASPNGYLLGSYRIATAPEPNSSRLTSFKSRCFESPVNNVGPWAASQVSLPAVPAVAKLIPSFRKSPGQREGHRPTRSSAKPPADKPPSTGSPNPRHTAKGGAGRGPLCGSALAKSWGRAGRDASAGLFRWGRWGAGGSRRLGQSCRRARGRTRRGWRSRSGGRRRRSVWR